MSNPQNMQKQRFREIYTKPAVPWRLAIIMSVAIIISLLTSCMTTVKFAEDEYFSQVYEDTPGTKDELYLRANQWLIKTFVDASSVIQHRDKEAGVIIGKFRLHGELKTVGLYHNSYDNRIYIIVEISVKDQKSRIEVKPQGSWTYMSGSENEYSKDDAKKDIELLAESFHRAMTKQAIDF